MTPLFFDIIIVLLVLLSTALGFMRGFSKEVFTIFGWVAAIVATIYFMPVLRPYGRQLIHNPIFADLVTSSAIFLGTIMLCSAISYFATSTLHASRLGFVDRVLGFAFGILRAIVLLGLGYLLFTYVYANEDNRPKFVTEAKTRPFLEASSGWLQAILPLDKALNVAEEKISAEKEKIEAEKNKETDKKIENNKTEKAVEPTANEPGKDVFHQ